MVEKPFQKTNKMIKLNLGCGNDKREGFINADIDGDADLLWDLNRFPYPFKENSVDFIIASHIVEHLKEPLDFFKEIKRILKPKGVAKISVPHYKSKGAYCSFGHKGFYHEEAINCVCENGEDNSFNNLNFKLLSTKIQRGRFLKWQKRQIFWSIQKI